MWVYVNSESGLWTVGFYDPQGRWHSDSDHSVQEDAACRVHYLNGGDEEQERGRISVTVVPINSGDGNLPPSFFN